MEEVQFLNFRKNFDGSCRKIALELNQLFGVELLSQSSAAASRSFRFASLAARYVSTFRAISFDNFRRLFVYMFISDFGHFTCG